MSAVITPCGNYRYTLWRGDLSHKVVFVMLNPSTADQDTDDRTVARCRRFAVDWGYSGLCVVNLYAFRATDPADMRTAADPIGPVNDLYIALETLDADVICAWGSNAEPERAAAVLKLLQKGARSISALHVNKDGTPKHPLYVRADAIRVPYPTNGIGY